MAEQEQEIRSLASFLCVSCGKPSVNKQIQVASIQVENGVKVQGLCTIAKYLARKSTTRNILGSCPEEEAAISQWLEYRVTSVDRCGSEKDVQVVLQELDNYLSDKVYFIGHHLTLADLLLYYGLHGVLSELTFYEKQKYMHVSRWFDQVQHTNGVKQKWTHIYFQKNMLYSGHSH